MHCWQIIGAVTILALATSAAGQKPQTADASKSTSAEQVVRITLPNYAGEVPKGPNVEVYESHCLICHSVRYVTAQPDFSRSTWEKEVKKMVDAYGATISEGDQPKIVDYLVAVRGTPERK